MIVPIFSVRFCLAETYNTYNGVFCYMVLHGTTWYYTARSSHWAGS